MKPVSFLHENVHVEKSKGRGRGVFAKTSIKAGVVIEIAPVIVMNAKDRKLLDQTLLHDYIFEWGDSKKECCMALGYVSLYNHSYEANCVYEMDFKKQEISIKAVRNLREGEQLFINYNGESNSEAPVWFDVK